MCSKDHRTFMQGIVTSINSHRVLTKLRRAGVVRDVSIDIWLCAFLLAGTAKLQTFLRSITSLMAVQLTLLS